MRGQRNPRQAGIPNTTSKLSPQTRVAFFAVNVSHSSCYWSYCVTLSNFREGIGCLFVLIPMVFCHLHCFVSEGVQRVRNVCGFCFGCEACILLSLQKIDLLSGGNLLKPICCQQSFTKDLAQIWPSAAKSYREQGNCNCVESCYDGSW